MKEKTFRERENEVSRGKKHYQERLIQDKEALDEIESFLKEQDKESKHEDSTPNRNFT